MDAMTCRAICRVLGTDAGPLSRQTLERWIRAGVIRPAVETGGKRRRLYSPVDTLALAVGRGMRASGVSWDIAGRVVDVIRAQAMPQLLQSFSRGKTHILLIDGKPMPRLVSRDAIQGAIAQQRELIQATGAMIMAVDVAACYERIRATVEAENAKA